MSGSKRTTPGPPHHPEGPGEVLRERRKEIEAAISWRDLSPLVLSQDSGRRIPLPSGSVQLVVTSPPYPYVEMWDRSLERALRIPRGSLASGARHLSALHRHLSRTWKECYRLLDEGGLLCVNIGDATRTLDGEFRLLPNHAEVIRACEGLGFRSMVPILWKKPTNKPNSFLGSGFAPPNAYVTLDCEHILIFRKGARRKIPSGDVLRAASQFSKEERDRWFSQVWEVRGASQRDGAAAFPPEIPYRLIRMFSLLGDTVLDPFAGKGTTLRVAWELGRRAVGVELDPARAEEARRAVPAVPPSIPRVLDELTARYR